MSFSYEALKRLIPTTIHPSLSSFEPKKARERVDPFRSLLPCVPLSTPTYTAEFLELLTTVAPSAEVYSALPTFDFKKIYGEPRDHSSGKQAPYETNAELLPFYAFEDFFLLPHLLPKREEKGEPFSLFRGHILYTRKRLAKKESGEAFLQEYPERNLLVRIENLPLAFPSQGFAWDSWFPFSLQEVSRLRRLFSSSDHAVPEQTDPFLLFKFPEKRRKYIGMEIDLYLARRDQYLPDFPGYQNISAGYSRPFAFPVVSLIQYARPIEQNALTGLLFQTKNGQWKPVETYGTEEFDENIITFDPRRLP